MFVSNLNKMIEASQRRVGFENISILKLLEDWHRTTDFRYRQPVERKKEQEREGKRDRKRGEVGEREKREEKQEEDSFDTIKVLNYSSAVQLAD